MSHRELSRIVNKADIDNSMHFYNLVPHVRYLVPCSFPQARSSIRQYPRTDLKRRYLFSSAATSLVSIVSRGHTWPSDSSKQSQLQLRWKGRQRDRRRDYESRRESLESSSVSK
ncbi:hypothetical protein HN011_012375 [Eciton burchellii]|nr:hypothetical protein HN011_012375 [Eciton burchellii]